MSNLVKDTALEERQKKVNDALAISLLDAEYPTPETIELATKYVDGKIEVEEMRQIILNRYKN